MFFVLWLRKAKSRNPIEFTDRTTDRDQPETATSIAGGLVVLRPMA
jgi:hypothetical protein